MRGDLSQGTFPLPGLEWRSDRPQSPASVPPLHEWFVGDGIVWTSLHRLGSVYLVRFPGLADFEVSPDGHSVSAYGVPGIARETVHHLYLNQVLPLALSRQHRMVLHGSAVEVGDDAIAFIGPSGRGKSTLAASFSISGHRFLTDDGLILSEEGDGYRVQSGHPSIRLWSDSQQALIPDSVSVAPAVDHTPKARLLAGGEIAFSPDPLPLRCIYVLGNADVDRALITPCSGRDALIEVVRNCFLLDVEERAFLRHHHDALLKMVQRVPFFHLDFPRRYEQLPAVHAAVREHMSTIPDR